MVFLATKHDTAYGVVVGQHADDKLAVQEIAEVGRRPEPYVVQSRQLIFAADIGNHRPPGGSQVRGHGRAHVAKTDEAYLAFDRSNVRGCTGAGFVARRRRRARRENTGIEIAHWDTLLICMFALV